MSGPKSHPQIYLINKCKIQTFKYLSFIYNSFWNQIFWNGYINIFFFDDIEKRSVFFFLSSKQRGMPNEHLHRDQYGRGYFQTLVYG